jgi:predicted metal-dependent hydrolase
MVGWFPTQCSPLIVQCYLIGMPYEKKIIKVDGRTLTYELCRSARAKSVTLRIHPGPAEGGRVVLTVPKRASVQNAERFLTDHASWVVDQVKQLAGRETILPYTGRQEYRKRREEALSFVQRKVEHWNGMYGFEYGSVSVRDQKTRWGSCSGKGNLSFSWKLIMLPERMADYVIVHELCHLKEFNHSPRFWELVSQAIPDCRHIARELRKG